MPSGQTLQDKVRSLRTVNVAPLAVANQSNFLAMAVPAAIAAFPGSASHLVAARAGSLVSTKGHRDEATGEGYCSEPLQGGEFVLWASTHYAARLPIRLGRVLRIVGEDHSPYIVVESWWPLLKPQSYGARLNLFGTRAPRAEPIAIASGLGKKRRTRALLGCETGHQILVEMGDVMVWPIALEPGALDDEDTGGRIPFSALQCVQIHFPIVLTCEELAFSPRGQEFVAYLNSAS